MEILDKNNKELCGEYESFASTDRNGVFMQSLNWTKVKDNWGWEAVISRDSDGKIQGTCLVLIKKIPIFGCSFLYAPHGPVCDYHNKAVIEDLFEGIKVLAKKHKCYEFMWDPCFVEKDEKAKNILTEMGFSHIENAPELSTIQARNNYMLLNIEGKTPDEVIAGFHSKWRYNIRLASRKGVICKACGPEAIDDFYPMMAETGNRDGFAIRPKEYFVKMLTALGHNHCRLYMCYLQNEDGTETPVSGAITTQYAGKTCYVYGASSNKHRNVMPNHLMQWTMIQWALENNNFIYDFQGIPFYTDETHPNYGVYKFKKGFNGEVVTYAGEFYYTFSPFKKRLVNFFENIYRGLHELQRRFKLASRHK